MLKSRKVPTLDDRGWLEHSVEEKLDQLLGDFFVADGAQSTFHYGELMSYQKLIATNVLDVSKMRSDVEMYLNRYLQTYFRQVTVEVSYTELDGTPLSPDDAEYENTIGFLIKTTVTENEVTYYDKPVIFTGGKFQYVLDKFNGVI